MVKSALIRSSLALRLCVAVLALVGGWAYAASDSLDGGEPQAPREDPESRSSNDSHADATQSKAATDRRDDPCAAEEKRIQERKKWLAQRARDQAKRGMPDPNTGVPNLTGVYCEAHPNDEQCRMGPPPTSFEPDELSIDAIKTPEDRDPYVIALKRELQRCRGRFGN